MRFLADVGLTVAAASQLSAYQHQVDAGPDYAARVSLARDLFGRRNKKRDPAFGPVRDALAQMCGGTVRCCYCEDSLADEVEHIRPKDLYPEATFVWANLLYACGPCNGPKNSKFAILDPMTGGLIDVTRPRGAPVRAPSAGDGALIDPRGENPKDFLELDLGGTFYFLAVEGLPPRQRTRADYTIDILGLNSRDVLVSARRNAFGSYLARLEQYAERRMNGGPAEEMVVLVEDLLATPHRTVWLEMQRQQQLYPKLQLLFAAAPEALTW